MHHVAVWPRLTVTTAAIVLAVTMVGTACASSDQGVTATRSATAVTATGETQPSGTGPAETQPPVSEPVPTGPPPTDSLPPLNTDPGNPLDPPADTTPPLPGGGRIDFGDAKAPQDYDNFMNAALADIDAFFAEVVPDIYGIPFTPVGTVYAHYPDRGDLPVVCGDQAVFE